MKPKVTVIVFGTQEVGHTRRLLPIINELARADICAHVFTRDCYRAEIENAGGHYIDLFSRYPLDEADAISVPFSCRYVSFAGHFAEQVIAEAAALKPSLVLHDAQAVIGEVVARQLGVPRVNVCAGHNLTPEIAVKALHHYPSICISENCWHAVKTLRERYGMVDASPFSYATRLSPDLNLYCEPPQYLNEDEREPFKPIEFIGSLSEQTINRDLPASSPYGEETANKQRLYVSFGTVVWRRYPKEAQLAMEAIRNAVAELPDFATIVSLGGAQAGDWASRLKLPNFQVENYVDQWNVLSASSIFLTHHGLNSTHEAVFQRVPMISYPFFHDQPMLARRSQDLGLAVPLVTEVRGQISAAELHAALSHIESQRETMLARLSEARQWELDVIASRPKVIQRILNLIQ